MPSRMAKRPQLCGRFSLISNNDRASANRLATASLAAKKRRCFLRYASATRWSKNSPLPRKFTVTLVEFVIMRSASADQGRYAEQRSGDIGRRLGRGSMVGQLTV